MDIANGASSDPRKPKEVAFQDISHRLIKVRRIELSNEVQDQLRSVLDVGWARASGEGREEDFIKAVNALAERLPTAMPETLMLEAPKHTAVAHEEAFAVAMRDLCPLWPFC